MNKQHPKQRARKKKKNTYIPVFVCLALFVTEIRLQLYVTLIIARNLSRRIFNKSISLPWRTDDGYSDMTSSDVQKEREGVFVSVYAREQEREKVTK